jgi:predicted nuclease of predicted toxin-antitoxin system
MRILLDECLPRRLKMHFPVDSVPKTVQEQRWSGIRNGELMRRAELEFDVFVTMDRGIEYQQNLAGFNLAVILLRAASNRLQDLVPLLPDLIGLYSRRSQGIYIRCNVVNIMF